MKPIFVDREGRILNGNNPVTPLPEVPPTEPVSMDDLFKEAQVEALKVSTKK